ncbi:WYL domain-containing protein [Cyanobacterium stanieri LEGE 03274]|uniref:WYL domain-containing protein n=1 Tax=Cyanobacterium stanieri LEGE 03274 TaxID=1828756 RepID=A0ABR9V1I9_9CHRO|nr:WYL domain-containing protein [Cyanobacterium stanieri]MBE9221757.1 WYL domain-containing protein [Cyanobacterium stanieri LEGE 03274]
MLCHFLIGVPASGKSTFAKLLAQTGNYQIISTDTVRKQLYGDEIIQGNWQEIEQKVIEQIKQAYDKNLPIIYDATNTKRPWRFDFLNKIRERVGKIDWVAWYLNPDVDTCKKRNQERDRQVPEYIIDEMTKSLRRFPPHVAEGFIHIYEVKIDTPYKLSFITKKLDSLNRRIINRHNRTNVDNITLHRYSRLMDFDRLLHLISLLASYSELGNLQYAYPQIIENIFGELLSFDDSISEITAIMARLKGTIYADKLAIAEDLKFLGNYGLVNGGEKDYKYQETVVVDQDIVTHYASDKYTFERILNTIKTILDNPFLPTVEAEYLNQYFPESQHKDDPTKSSLSGHLTNLTVHLMAQEKCHIKHLKARRDLLRKDIEYILKPYQILPNTMRNGYFLGTGILSPQELIDTFRLLQTQAKNIDDPLALNLYNDFERKMRLAHFDDNYIYPVRAIANRSMIDTDSLDSKTLSNQTERLQNLIEQRKLVKLNKFANRARYEGETNGGFDAWLLQIVFYNFAWYLGFQHQGGEKDKLFRFERLDRLYIEQETPQTQTIIQQKKALNHLNKLLSASYGIYLGNDIHQQKTFLSKQKKNAEVKIELWFSEDIFKFIAEGTKRFSTQQMKMTKPAFSVYNSSIFSLDKSPDNNKPYRFQVTLPIWSLNDFDLIRWILGFGGEVKVHQPEILRTKIIEISKNIMDVY